MVLVVRLHIISIVLLWGINSRAAASADYAIAKPNCTAHCGGVSIPYPFGIGPNSSCYFDEWFQIDCHNSTTPIFRRSKLEVLDVSVISQDGSYTLRVKSPVTFFSCKGKEIRQAANLTGSPFVYSRERNQFVAVSCDFFASVSSDPENLVGGCKSICEANSDRYYESCDTGFNCCRATIPPYLTIINSSIQAHAGKSRITDCDDYAFLVEQEWFENNITTFWDVQTMDSVPVVLNWSLSLDNNKALFKLFEGFSTQQRKKPNDPAPFCSINNATETYNNQSTVECNCPDGFEGNPFLLQPCQDIDECKVDPCFTSDYSSTTDVRSISNALCKNTIGGHTCYNLTGATCEFWANGSVICYNITSEATREATRSNKRMHLFSDLALGIPLSFGLGFGLGLGVLLLLIAAWWAQKTVKKRKHIKRRKKFFKENGGLLLEQQMSSGTVNIEKIKLFNSNELEKSTDNFKIDRVLGQGGQGTVFKGTLADGNIVAVKKSKIDHKGKVSEFINEVIILSQINHRNIVQLLGCCLETEVPLLVYEFIPNGTLSQYIYEQNQEFPLTWQMRLQIATEIAGALSYLHAAASCPIYHRDIKSTNILLDEKYRAKIADFGISRSVAIDQTHLTTNVHGTFGYMDPEYFQSSQFTEKSDVYSFGVVLVELLTGQKPISAVTRSTEAEGEEEGEEEEYRSLATYFIVSMQGDRLFNILDARVVNEGSKEDIMKVADLARRCLNLNGRNRPTMREVTAELEAIQMSNRTHQGAELILEVHYPIDLCDDVVSSSTGSTWDSGPASSLLELPQSSM